MKAAAVSPATGRRYGVDRVCDAWGAPRSSYYLALKSRKSGKFRSAASSGGAETGTGAENVVAFPADRSASRKRPGPEPTVSDEVLLKAIQKDMKRSHWGGEGHRKVHARLRRDGLKIGKKRVLRLMRENGLLSPHRKRPGPERTHGGKIVTDAPDVMWAIDAAMIPTVREGYARVFGVVEHWNGEFMGFCVSKSGTNVPAREAVAMAIHRRYGRLGPDVACGIAIHHDHGSCFMARDFRAEIKAWGMTPSRALVRQPQTNGVVERFFRTMKEQACRGRVFETVEDVRAAIREFMEHYNAKWLLAKNGHLSPNEARWNWNLENQQEAA